MSFSDRQYLKIENPGVAPTDMFTLIGASTTRTCDVDGTIGLFGSGSKFSVNLLLRKDIKFHIYCGLQRLDFYIKGREVDDGLTTIELNRVCVKVTGKDEEGNQKNYREPLGWVVETGSLDWDDVNMACREFVANAFDRCLRQTGSHKDVQFEVVPENRIRAKDEHTRVFIEFTPEIAKFYSELPKRFLFVNGSVQKGILKKSDRNMISQNGPVVYRNGVYVREDEYTTAPSMFDYNFGEDVRLNESRTLSDYEIKDVAARYLQRANKTERDTIIQNLIKGDNFWEWGLSEWSLTYDLSDEIKEAWLSAFPNHITPCGSALESELLTRKGHFPLICPASWYSLFQKCGLLTADKVLSKDELEGTTFDEVPHIVRHYFDNTWGHLVDCGFGMERASPSLKVYRKVETTNDVKGYYRDGTVYLNSVYAGDTTDMRITILEELVHHATQDTDLSRGFQEYLLRFIVETILPQ